MPWTQHAEKVWDTHAMCDACWHDRDPQRRPVRIRTRTVQRCCWCGATTRSGIYVRAHYTEARACGGHD